MQFTREPAVAGRFYPADEDQIANELATLLPDSPSQKRALALMLPHAGWVYSGALVAKVLSQVRVPRRVIILCPNHTGRGPSIAVAHGGEFRIPGTTIATDDSATQRILDAVAEARADWSAHESEHAIEVELPFLQRLQPELKIVPIVLGALRCDEATALGETLWRVFADESEDTLLIASSDMSHFLPDDEARAIDKRALAPLLAGQPEALYQRVVDERISMCGFIPATVMASYARAAGARAPALAGYATSGDAFGDRSRVVGYAGVIIRSELS